jgi:hypothetical protein
MSFWKNLTSFVASLNNPSSDERLLFELYKNTLSELQHQENLITKLINGLFVILPIFSTAIIFLFSDFSKYSLSYIFPLKLAIVVGLGIFLLFFWWSYIQLLKRNDYLFYISRKN